MEFLYESQSLGFRAVDGCPLFSSVACGLATIRAHESLRELHMFFRG